MRRGWMYVELLLAVCVSVAMVGSVSAWAASAPGWEVFTYVTPTKLPPGGEGEIRLRVYNTGGAPGQATVTDTLPAGLTATGISAERLYPRGQVGVSSCEVSNLVRCVLGETPSLGVWEIIIAVKVGAGVLSGSEASNLAVVVGKGAASPARESRMVKFGAAAGELGSPAEFGLENADAWFTSVDGTTDTQAGSHPYELTVVFSTNHVGSGGFGSEFPSGGEVKDLNVNLPPGIVGDPTAVPQCTRAQLDEQSLIDNGFENEGEGCPADTQVGVEMVNVNGVRETLPVFNIVPPAGMPAQFAFVYGGVAVFLDAGVRSGGATAEASDYGISEHIDNQPQLSTILSSTTIWGVPAVENGSDLPPVALVTMPTSCEGPQRFSLDGVDSWQHPGEFASPIRVVTHDSQGAPVGFTGCDHLRFGPSLSTTPDTSYADSPAGLSVEVKTPQEGLLPPEGLGTSNLKNTTVTLPEGMVINPGQATGLQACQTYQDGQDGEGPPSCPAASKVGEDEIETPLLKNRLKGDVYILQNNPPEVKLLVAASGEGVNAKLIGTVHLDEATGRITATFTETPELPFTMFRLTFSGGAQAALVTPPRCGVYSTSAFFTPWSTPLVEELQTSTSYALTGGPDGTGCVSGALPFAPSMTAGSTTDQAGGYTNFSVLFQRPDGQQRVSKLQFKTPEGLLGMISSVTLCGEPQAAAGNCPASSQIGHTVVGAGPGPDPLFIPDPGDPPAPIYITGPYEGAPYGLSIVVPIIAGPFNLGTIVVRGRIEVNRRTAQLTVTTDPLPTIVKGIPADMRSINAVIDRPGFMFNPTSCAPMSFSGTVTSTEGTTAPVSSPLQVGSCRALTFKPNFQVSAPAKTSRIDGAGIDAKIVYPTGVLGHNQASSQSNIQAVKVELPKRLPSRLTTLQKACLAAVFEANPASCPPASVVGHALARTPVLPVPLTGPAYFVSHGGEAFPSLIIVLQGYGVTVEVVGSTYISPKGITSSTFKQIPDVPITLFELVLPQGPYSALSANGNLCQGTLRMPTDFTAQDGAVRDQNTKITVTGCPRAKQAKAKHRRKTGKGAKGSKAGRGKSRRGGHGARG
jgi:hypothetical protein